MGVIAWFLPALAARSSMRDKLVRDALPWFRGTVTLGDVSLGWLSPVRVRGVVVQDEHGRPLAEVAEASTAKSLWSLLWDRQDLGEIQLAQPIVHAEVRPGGSNLEDALAPLLAMESRGGGIACKLNIAGGKCILRQNETRGESVIDEIDAFVVIPGNASLPYSFELAARISDGAASGEWKTSGEWRSASSPWGVGTLNWQTRGVPLAALAPVLARTEVEAQIAGRIDGRYEVILEENGKRTFLVNELAAEGLALRAPQVGKDEVRLARLDISGEVALTDQAISLRDVNLVCDAGRLRISGGAPRSALSASQVFAALRETTFDAEGEVDLARLAQLVPQTLHLREGLTVTSGAVRIRCGTQGEQGDRRWAGRLEASGLAADHEGRRITWEQPLSATFAIRDSHHGPLLDQLACESDFFRASGRGSLAEGSLTLAGDLSKLAAELSRFVNLGPMQFGGAVEGDLQWRREGQTQETIRGDGQVRLTNFEWSAAGRRPWREPQLAIDFTAAGVADDKSIHRIDEVRLELQSGGDAALVRLTAPVESPTAATEWPVHCEARGELSSWTPRVENFASLPPGTIEGRFSVAATGAASKSKVAMENVEVAIESLDYQAPGVTIREPRVEAQGDFAWDGEAHTIAIKQATCASASVAFRAGNVALNLSPSTPAASGKIDFRADLQRLSSWMHSPDSPPKAHLAGAATGQLEARLTGSGVFFGQPGNQGEGASAEKDSRPRAAAHRAAAPSIQIQGAADVENFAYALPTPLAVSRAPMFPASAAVAAAPLWQEPRLRLALNATYSPEADLVDAEQIAIAGESLSLSAQGKITEATNVCRVDLAGQHNYDLMKLLSRLRPWIGDDLKMAGRGPKPFTISGPLFGRPSAEHDSRPQLVSPELIAKTSVAWTSAEYSGIQTAAGEAAIELKEGVVALGPLDLPVSDGRMSLAAKLPLNTAPLAVLIDSGPVLQNVRISPEMCRSWLKYVAPLVADATQAEGRFSVELQQPSRIPLHDPKLCEVRGLLKVHAAQVGPGPLSRQFLTLADGIKAAIERKPAPAGESGSAAWLQIPEQAIPFEAAGGRVYHRDLTVTAKDVVIRTRGSVGLDQSLELLADVPIQDAWIKNEPLLAGFQGQSLQVPVSGSLTSPRLDQAALDRLAQQLLGNAARRLLEDNLKPPPEIKNALDRLFRGKQ
jgi:hypothetical protein